MAQKDFQSVEDVIRIGRQHRDIYGLELEGNTSLMKYLNTGGQSSLGAAAGRKEHPFNMEGALNLKDLNIHHSTCIEAKRDATIGLGFKSDELEDTFNDMCEISLHGDLNDMTEDFWQLGNSYLEIVREDPSTPNSPIEGIFHVQAPSVYKNVPDSKKPSDFYWEILNQEEYSDVKFAKFGDWKRLAEFGSSELIYWPKPTSRSRWYGLPDWMSAVPILELVQCMIQNEFDFFLNRGVPEFLLFLLGGIVPDPTWQKLLASLKAHIGIGNAYKSTAINLSSPDIKVQLEKLGLGERAQGVFAEYADTTGLMIVSAHRVPPLLAGIQIPGKLGANNELPNALMAFQLLVVGQSQRSLKSVLKSTLGDPTKNGGINISNEAFEFKTILDEMNLNAMDTIGRMREPVTGSNRDVRQGLKS